MPHFQAGVGSIRPALSRNNTPSKHSSAPSDQYKDGFDDARRGAAPEKRIAVYQSASENSTDETRDKLHLELEGLTAKEEKTSTDVAAAQIALTQRPPQMQMGLAVMIGYILVLLAGLSAEVVMTVPLVELWGAHPLLLWPSAVAFASLAPLATKLAIGERPLFEIESLRWVCGAFALVMVVLLSHERAKALRFEAQMGDWFVSALVGERVWATFLSLLVVNAILAFFTATLVEMFMRERHTRKVRRTWERLNRDHSEQRKTIASIERELTNLDQRAASKLQATVSEYELGYAHGSGGEVPQNEPGLAARGWAMFRKQGTVALLLALASAGCSDDSFVDSTPKNATVVILDPYGAAPMPMESAFAIANDVLSRTGRCTTLLFATPKGYHGNDQSFRLTLPCSAERTRRDQDLGEVYAEFHEKFPALLERWFHVPDWDRWHTDYSGTLRRAEEELKLVDGNRVLVVISGLWWPDPEKGPPALGPLPVMDFSGTRAYIGFTHGFAAAYDYSFEDRDGTFDDYPQFVENWSQRFLAWGAQLSTAAFGPQNAREWIARNISRTETPAYLKWQQQRAFRGRQSPSPEDIPSPQGDESQPKKLPLRRPLLEASYSLGPVGQ